MILSWAARGAASAERGRRMMELRGVTPNGHPLWAPWEVQPVVAIYPEYRSIFPLLNRRTKPAVYHKAGRLGITKSRPPLWSDNEIIRIRKVYPSGTYDEILAAFPGRTIVAVARAANQRGIFRLPRPCSSALLKFGLSALPSQINKRGLCPHPLLQDVRNRCLELGVAFRYVGNAIGKPRVLALSASRLQGVDHTGLALATVVLGGELYAEWED